MQAVILAGGVGSRLKPYTNLVPKPMVRVGNKPFMDYIIDSLVRNKVKKILLCVGYKSYIIKNHYMNGKDFGAEISYSKDKKSLGTGGALKQAENLIEDEFLLLYGDSFLPIHHQDLFDFRNTLKTSGVLTGYYRQCSDVKPNLSAKDNIVVKYDKENGSGCDLVEAGVSVWNKEILEYIPKNTKCSLESDIFPLLIRQKELGVFITRQRFFDIGTPKRLEEAKQALGRNFIDGGE